MHLMEFCSLSARRGIDRTASSSGHSPLKPGRGAGGKRGGVRWSAVECGGARWRAVEKMDNRQPEMPERCHGAAGAGAAVRCTRGGVGTRSELVADGMLRCTCDARSSVAQTLNFRISRQPQMSFPFVLGPRIGFGSPKREACKAYRKKLNICCETSGNRSCLHTRPDHCELHGQPCCFTDLHATRTRQPRLEPVRRRIDTYVHASHRVESAT